jgi:hypothetical protein
MRNSINKFFTIAVLSVFFGCTKGGQLSEVDIVIRDAATLQPQPGVRVEFVQFIPGLFSSDSRTATFKTDAAGKLNRFYFTEPGANYTVYIGLLSDTSRTCYPSFRLNPGDKTEINLKVQLPTTNLQLDFSKFLARTGESAFNLRISHKPVDDQSNFFECGMEVFRENLLQEDLPIFDFNIYPFGVYRITGNGLGTFSNRFDITIYPESSDQLIVQEIE